MSNYVIGDLQGCYDQLMSLLELIDFDDKQDKLWLVGDLVNRGPNSLAVLRFLSKLENTPNIVWGNHDLHLLALYHKSREINDNDTLQELLRAPDIDELASWLSAQKLIYYDKDFNVLMVHAGICHTWSLAQALELSKEIEDYIQSDFAYDFFKNMYGNTPNYWDDGLTGYDRARVIINYCTRIRLCYSDGSLDLNYHGRIENKPEDLIPWYLQAGIWREMPLLFGHWAALGGKTGQSNVFALDTGCVWGNSLTAMRLEDHKIFSVKGWKQDGTK